MQFAAKLLHSVENRKTDDVHLIGVQHFDVNDGYVRSEYERIAPQLQPALTRDIADNGTAFAEEIDKQLGSDTAQQVMTLLLTSSLSRAVGGRIGLTENEIVEYLVSPTKTADDLKSAIAHLIDRAWFLHREDHRYYVKETENLAKQIERTAKSIPQSKIDQAFINRVTGILEPRERRAYHSVYVIPKIKNIQLSGSRVLIVVRPDGRVPPSEIQNYFSQSTHKNNLLVLSGEDSHLADVVEERLRLLFAAEQISSGLKQGDSLHEEAIERVNQAIELFHKALSASYNRIYYPGIEGTDGSERLLPVTFEHGLSLGDGDHSAEKQIESILSGPRGNYKLALDLKNSAQSYIAMAEDMLWTAGLQKRGVRWLDVITRAKSLPAWPWMPGSGGMETLKSEALKRNKWRLIGNNHIEKGPFPKDKTSLMVSALSVDENSKETILSLSPRNAGATPRIHYSTDAKVSCDDAVVQDSDNFRTKEGTLYFLVIDTEGEFESGPPECWKADIKIQHQIETIVDRRQVRLQSTPTADIFYTVDSTSPRNGKKYSEPFEVGNEAFRLLVYAKSGAAVKEATFRIPASGQKKLVIDELKPAQLIETSQISLSSADKIWDVISRFRGESETVFNGVRIELGDSDDTIIVRLTKKPLTASSIEKLVDLLRETLSITSTSITIKVYRGIHFQNGLGLKDFAKIAGITLVQSNVAQDA